MPHSLDSVVTSVGAQLMEATSTTATRVCEKVLAQLVKQFDVDASFLRYHDHDIGSSTLVAQWPPRLDGADPDLPASVPCAHFDPVFAQCEQGRKPVVMMGAEMAHRLLPGWLAESKQRASPSVAAAPLVSVDMTTGVVGFIKFGTRKWKQEEVNTLAAVAALFAQLQARIAAEEKLRYLAEHDDLTGLCNRRALVAYLSDRLCAEKPGPVAVLYLNLDRLKSINEHLGHTVGDRFIRAFAQRLRVCAEGQKMIARLGGDGFVVIPDQSMSIEIAESFAGRLGQALREHVEVGGHVITRTVSIGLAVGMPGRDSTTDLLRRADEAVLTARRAGGNQVALSTGTASAKKAVRSDIEFDLQSGIDQESLLLHYLPEIDLWTGAVVGVEALIRWQHPNLGLLLPDSFIEIAETNNLSGELAKFVMRSACAEFSKWRSRGVGRNCVLRINVSPVQLANHGFVRSVADTIEEFGLDGRSVCFELTERAVVHDIAATRQILSELKEVGVQIAIDDFGTGYAVLSHLKSLPIDVLKIDTGFVRNLGSSVRDLAIVRAIIGLAEAFGLGLVAEGVETPAAAITLMKHGCHRAQGFLFSQPVAAREMEALLFARRVPMPFLADLLDVGDRLASVELK
ncbi:MAG: EAL domain-containing protein [Mycobacteriaceae bacterium]|nr:EAL domain-containing protein [Mycobacteriaceae bacterium]